MRRIFVSLLSVNILIGITFLFMYFAVDPIITPSERGERTVGEVIEQIPTEPAFYVMMVALIVLRVWQRWWNSVKVRQDTQRRMRADRAHQLNNREWGLVRDLRERALSLRARADLIFGGGFLALLAGIYGVIFVLPEISGQDPGRIASGLFKTQFGNELGCIVEEKCIVRLPSGSSIISALEQEGTVNKQQVTNGERKNNVEIRYQVDVSGVNLQDERIEFNRKHFLNSKGFPPATIDSVGGKLGMVAGSGRSVWITQDQGETWIRRTLTREREENTTVTHIAAMAFDGAGRFGMVASGGETIWVTRDRGETWSRRTLQLKKLEFIKAITVDGEGKFGMVAGDEGSIWMTRDQGETWSRQALELKEREYVRTIAVGREGMFGIVAVGDGSIWMTRNRGETWDKRTLELKDSEFIKVMAIDEEGKLAMIAGDEGSVWITGDRGDTWSKRTFEFKEREYVAAIAVGREGKFGIVVGDNGSAWMTRDRGETWNPLALEQTLGTETGIMGVALDLEEGRVVVLALRPHLLITVGGSTRRDDTIPRLQMGDEVTEGVFSEDGSVGVFGLSSGSIWMLQERGRRLSRLALELRPREWLEAGVLSSDGKFGIVAGSSGSTWVTRDGVEGWTAVTLELKERERISEAFIFKGTRDGKGDSSSGVAFAGEDGNIGIIETNGETRFVVKSYPQLRNWSTWSLTRVQDELRADNILRESDFFRRVNEFSLSMGKELRGTYGGNANSKLFGGMLDSLTILRISTLAVMFFFVQMLIRLYQYNLRLAAFWDSRADAILVAGSFVGEKTVRFDDLVEAMAPDAYDFKVPPRSPTDRLWARRKS